MECVTGKTTYTVSAQQLADRAAQYHDVLIDLGTGDGRFVQHWARQQPQRLVIGVDACRAPLQPISRTCPANVLFVIANVYAVPSALHGIASQITINFPWGSLLYGLIDGDAVLHQQVRALARPKAQLEVRLNGGALSEAGYELAAGSKRVVEALQTDGWTVRLIESMNAAALRSFPSSWSKRVAFGRDPRALVLRARWNGTHISDRPWV